MCIHPAVFPSAIQKGFPRKEELLGVRFWSRQEIQSLGLKEVTYKYLLYPAALASHLPAKIAKEPAGLGTGPEENYFHR